MPSCSGHLGIPIPHSRTSARARPDYVLPSLEWYREYASDCIILTCKRTLRERWRQIVTEGATGQSFFLATIDEQLSGPELRRMQDRRVVVVVPERIRADRYPEVRNAISFETFFTHHLDPAMERWKAGGALENSAV